MLSRTVGHARLVTLTGPPGVGKSRLAAEAARVLAPAFPGGVLRVELQGLGDSRLLLEKVADIAGAKGGSDPLEAAAAALTARGALLVLEGCDQLLDGCRHLVSALIALDPGPTLLATSREALGVAGEHVVTLDPLAVPDEDDPPAAVGASPAVELLVGLAYPGVTRPAFTADEVAALGRLCRDLDGLPLALELVAAEVASSGPVGAAERLGAWMHADGPAPEGGSLERGALFEAFAWSLARVEEASRRVLETLSVCPAGADLATLRALGAASGLRRGELARALDDLEGRSLLQSHGEGKSRRFRLLAVLRRHLQETMRSEGRLALLEGAQLAWFAELYGPTEEALLSSAEQEGWLERIEVDLDNLRHALAFGLASGKTNDAARLARGLWRFFELRGRLSEGRLWLTRLLGSDVDPLLRERLLDGMGMLAWRQGDYEAAKKAFEEALALSIGRASKLDAARLRNHLGLAHLFAGDSVVAGELFRASAEASRIVDSPGDEALAVANQALVALEEGRLVEAAQLARYSLGLQLALGDRHGGATSRLHLAIASYYLGDERCSAEQAAEAAATFGELGDHRSVAFALLCLAACAAKTLPALCHELASAAGSLQRRLGVALPVGWDARVAAALAPAGPALPTSGPVSAYSAGAEAVPELVEKARVLLVWSAEEGALPGGGEPTISLKTLGGFQLAVGGTPVRLAPQVARLVKVVACAGQAVHVEQAIEMLWPEVSPERGRRRLRNVLARLRACAGPVVVREADKLALGPAVLLDSANFEAQVHRAADSLRSGGADAASRQAAREALRLYSGEFLPEDLYEEWASVPRERLARLRLRLLDLWAQAAEAAGEPTEAETCLRSAIEIDPVDERRYLALAQLLAATGRPAAAMKELSRATEMAEELGVKPSAALEDLKLSLLETT